MAKSSEKDRRMAADLKARDVKRETGRCVICRKIIRNADTLNHYRAHSYQG